MKHKFRVVVRCITYLETEVDANDFDEAYSIAEDLDGSEFEEQWGNAEWDISSIERDDGEMEWY